MDNCYPTNIANGFILMNMLDDFSSNQGLLSNKARILTLCLSNWRPSPL